MSNYSERFQRLARTAQRQHSLFAKAQALDAGLTTNQLYYGVRTKRFERISSSLYRMAGASTTWEQRLLGIILTGPEGTLASHRSAAYLWGLDGCRKGRPEVSVPRHCVPKTVNDARYHESTDLDLAAPTTRQGIPVTGIVRTQIDLSAVVSFERLTQAVNHAIRERMTTWETIAKVRARHSRRGRNGVGKMREFLEARYGSVIPDSHFGQLVADLLVDAGLPKPEIEFNVYSSNGKWLARVDLCFPDEKVITELDGKKYHMDEESFEKDRERQNRLELEGWTVLRFTWKFYSRHSRELCAAVAKALSRYCAN